MTAPGAKVLLDSISPAGDRLTTMEVVMHRFVLSEFNTHRAFSRNSASSRAIPTVKLIERVRNDPAMPLEWGTNQRGMQPGEPASAEVAAFAEQAWLSARDRAANHAQLLLDVNVHKQIVNRLLEPFLWHTVIVSSTEWDNFFQQRCSPLAQAEIRAVAGAMRDALAASAPMPVAVGEWHTPLILPGEELELHTENRCRVSAARCARVSYLTHDGERDYHADLDLYTRLMTADPPHWSPLEHVATPAEARYRALGNFRGWHQLRHLA